MRLRGTRLALLVVAWAVVPALGEPVRAVRGLAGQVEVDYPSRLRARAEQSLISPVMVRVTPVAGTTRQRIEFIGAVAGEFDLRDHLEREDGQPLSELGPLQVSIASRLPADHGTDLFGSADSWFNWRAYYREIMWGSVAAWAMVPVVAMVVRVMRRARVVEAPPPPAPPMTVEDQLRGALETARARALSIAERGQLELLIFRYLGERAGIGEVSGINLSEALRQIREDSETGGLVVAIERWLHARGGEEAGQEHAAAALDELRRSGLDRRPSRGPEVRA